MKNLIIVPRAPHEEQEFDLRKKRTKRKNIFIINNKIFKYILRLRCIGRI